LIVVRDAITFLRRGRRVVLRPANPTQTVLDYLRLEEKSKGTKEGCNEGDCGACTVALGRVKSGKLVYEPVNACILLVGHLHGRELVTVDDLAQGNELHPVQAAMVKNHGSQCGFCTPGFIMALFTLYHQRRAPTRAEIVDHIAGNLCRCTGYRPIVDAASDVCTGNPMDEWSKNEEATLAAFNSLESDQDVFITTEGGFVAIPSKAETLLRLAVEHADATLVSGATDVGLWVTKQLRVLPKVIHTFNLAELHDVSTSGNVLRIGAAATYGEAMQAMSELDVDVGEVMRRLGSTQVRASGTIGGNIANGSPIGDMAPMLIAMEAILHLRHGDARREIPLEDFFMAYGKQDRQPGELVWQVAVPTLKSNEDFRAYKISKRFDQDISAVMFALKVTREGNRLVNARLAMGGMAATPKRAILTEKALSTVNLLDETTYSTAIELLGQDFQPISDMRASSTYRLQTAQELLRKALLEISGETSSRVIGDRYHAA
jgi:xanthine dehydrogenase small subunit